MSEFSRMINEINGTTIKTEENKIAYRQEVDTARPTTGKLIYNKLTVPRGGEYLLVLSDGTEIWLNAESEIRYPVHFTGLTREVYLKGEAFFSVARNESQPFIVNAGKTQVKVLGTSFNLRCYPDEEEISTTLVSGIVTMSGGRQKKLKLLPGEQGVFNKEKLSLHKHAVETRFFTAWKDGRLVFRETRLEELLNTLARWYDLHISYTDTKAKDIRFTGDLDKTDDFKTLLKMLERGKRISCLVQDKTIYVSLR